MSGGGASRACYWMPRAAEYEARCSAAPRAAVGPCFRCNAPDSARVGPRRWLCRKCIHETSRPGILPFATTAAAARIARTAAAAGRR